MRGSVNWQVTEVYKSIDCIGESKHTAKEEARAAGAETWHEVGKAIGVFNYNTMADFKAIACQAFTAVQAEYGIRDLTKITGEQLAGWMADKIQAGDWQRATFDKYAAALEKLESAINVYCKNSQIDRQVQFDFKEVRALAAHTLGQRNDESRAFERPADIVVAINPKYELTAKIQLEGGGRINEVFKIYDHQLKGLRPDPITGEIKGWYGMIGKGGKTGDKSLSVATYHEIVAELNARGKTTIDALCGMRTDEKGQMKGWIQKTGSDGAQTPVSLKTYAKLERTFVPGSRCIEVSKRGYNNAIKRACEKTCQAYHGSHGFRWNWSQARFNELQTKAGYTHEQALSRVSQEMTHERSDITNHYLH